MPSTNFLVNEHTFLKVSCYLGWKAIVNWTCHDLVMQHHELNFLCLWLQHPIVKIPESGRCSSRLSLILEFLCVYTRCICLVLIKQQYLVVGILFWILNGKVAQYVVMILMYFDLDTLMYLYFLLRTVLPEV